MAKHVAMYVRVSTEEQNIENQLPDMEAWVEQNAKDDEVIWYQDHHTGRNMRRPGWRAMKLALVRNQIKTLVFWRVDRMARSFIDAIDFYKHVEALGIQLISLKENFDLSTPVGKLLFHMLISFAQWESDIRSERTKAGMARAKAAGKKIGGWQKSRLPPKASPRVIKTILMMAEARIGCSETARQLGLHRTTVYRVKKKYGGARLEHLMEEASLKYGKNKSGLQDGSEVGTLTEL